ncbi:MAG: SAM-dependent chlorinase/fluorinase [Bacteroidales bacterium]|nr:SAM-dependent chlorinase/fluorinase [Bacteroidales bacterium]MBN2698477.1 SAM-dependent chlorinase/fluorinase [Bacteroidales bacterium]
MPLVTLTSDWSESDYYIGAIKGRILSACPGASIQDINHHIKPFNTAQAAFVIRNCYPNFPDGTVHIIAVNTEPDPGCALLAAQMDNQYFLCADNGILGLIGKEESLDVYALNREKKEKAGSFAALQILTEAACAIMTGKKPAEIGKKITDYNRRVPLRPTIEKNSIIGSVIYIDSYENAITNISRELFERLGNHKKFEIQVQSRHNVIRKISNTYSENPPGDLLAVFNSIGLLEVAVRNGNAASLFKLNENSTIRIEFND